MTGDPAAPPLPPATFFGQPRGLAYLAFTEAWERFSYYGMTALLTLYMIGQLLLPGHVEHIAGFAAFRGAVERLTGPLSNQALASQVFGLYSGFVYFTPVLGGWLADRFIGRRAAIVSGALLMSGGHVAMAFDRSFLLALLLLIVGCGLLKGNISAQVGELYRRDDEAGRTRGFAIFSMAVNFGAVAGPVACGFLADRYGWHVGFGAAAVLMLCGLLTYLAGIRHLPGDRQPSRAAAPAAPLTRAEWRRVAALTAVMGITIFQSIAYYQISNVGLVWIEGNVDLALAGFRVPVPWFSAVDPFFSIVGVPALFALWRRQAAHRGEPGDLAKIGIGAAIAAASNLVLAVAALVGGRVGLIWPLAYCAGLGIAFLYYWPTLLALVAGAAPKRLVSTLMGCAFLSLFVGNTVIGWIGGYYERMGHAAFWAMHAAIAATGAVLILLFGRRLGHVLSSR
ncbi:peptide MFS transporter [Sphingomonas profundi]|uniref:peptide MFS transporter n=1 Tax=Alterirhizorhabdus profundi TaxID=2681549 RepID=UPI0012E7E42D|nr:peptide MFS transporter [Sphingomonas profundi]